MSEIMSVRVVVGLVADPKKGVLLKWNPKWGAFTFPLTKPSVSLPRESDAEAAVRAGAEALGVPVRVVEGATPRKIRELIRSERDSVLKNYVYTIVPIEAHPDFANLPTPTGSLWFDPKMLELKEYAPISETVYALLDELNEWKWV